MTSCDLFKNPKDKFDLQSERVTQIIKAQNDSIEIPKFFPDKDVRAPLHKEFNTFYEKREYGLAWLDFEEPSDQVTDLLEAIDEADEEGLDPESYKVAEIEKLLKEVYKIESRKERRKRITAKRSKNEEVAKEAKMQDTLKLHNLVKLDFLLTSAYLTYASHLLSGKILPNESESWFPERRKKDLAPHLDTALTQKNIKESLKDLLPKHIAYRKLRDVLHDFNGLSEDDWTVITPTNGIKEGDKDNEVFKLKKRLVLSKDLDEKNLESKDSSLFNGSVTKALISFQARHGLEESGKLDEKTLGAINVPLKERKDQIKLNMERMRWLPDEFGERYLLVNIPEFKFRIYEQEKVVMEMRVIVGKTFNATPIFSDEMEYIDFSPTWTVPKSIAVEEMLPKLIEDPEFLTRNNFTLYESWEKDAEPIEPEDVKWKKVSEEDFNYRIVQNPGEGNALGAVKFMFPNNLDIYLHDTPTGHLFDRRERNFSHGCIRVEKPVDLAEYLLKDNANWDREKINEAMKQDEPQQVVLSEKLPIHLVYWTTWIDDSGRLNFRDDIYQHDKSQMREQHKKKRKYGFSS